MVSKKHFYASLVLITILTFLSITTAQAADQVVFTDDFESGVNGWSVDGAVQSNTGNSTNNTNSQNILWHLENNQSNSPITSWTYNTGAPAYNYDVGSSWGSLTSPLIDLTNDTNADLTFYELYQTETTGTSWDKRIVQVSVNGGVFTNLEQLSGESMNVWHQHQIDISSYTGNLVQIRFFFDSVDTIANNYWGWSIEDFSITTSTSPPPTNNPPVANAGPDQSQTDSDGNGAETTTLDGTNSYDSDGTITNYEWLENNVVIASGTTPSVNLDVGAHTITLQVTDDQGDTDTDTVLITINPNQAPVADAGQDTTVTDDDNNGIEAVTLDGTNSYDSDGTITSYEWKEGGTILGTTSIVTSDFSVGTHTVTLTLIDNGGLSASNDVEIVVNEGSISTDTVTILKAEYNEDKNELKVEAKSDDPNAVLTLVGYGEMEYKEKKGIYKIKVKNTPNPGTITVTSSSGGSASSPVKIK